MCTCDKCMAQGSKELFEAISGKIRKLKMDSFVMPVPNTKAPSYLGQVVCAAD